MSKKNPPPEGQRNEWNFDLRTHKSEFWIYELVNSKNKNWSSSNRFFFGGTSKKRIKKNQNELSFSIAIGFTYFWKKSCAERDIIVKYKNSISFSFLKDILLFFLFKIQLVSSWFFYSIYSDLFSFTKFLTFYIFIMISYSI